VRVTEENGMSVSFTVKELLARQDGKLDTITLLLNSKAEKTEVAALEGRIMSLERTDSKQSGSQSLFWRAMPLIISFGALIVAIIVMAR
jgi:hypothetical protein